MDEAPVHRERVRPEWIDDNGHMNVAYYVLVFDHATDAVLDGIGLGSAYRAARRCSMFVSEAHITYEQEVVAGDDLAVATRLLDVSRSRLILYHEMTCPRMIGVVASNEVLCVHVDLDRRRAAAIPADRTEVVRALQARHAHLPRPRRSGRWVSLLNRRPS